MYKKASYFTLMEVLVAILIMAIGLSVAFTISGKAKSDAGLSQERWANEHLANLACEHFLLAGPDAPLPNNLLPEGFTASCEVEFMGDSDIAEELPEFTLEPISGWNLAIYTVTVYKGGDLLIERKIEKIVKEERFL